MPPSEPQRLAAGRFFGVTRTRYCEGGLVLSEIVHAGARRLPSHSHERAYFGLLLEGTYEEQCGRRVLSYRPWTLGFHPSDFVHRDRVGETGGRFFTIEVDGAWLDRVGDLRPDSWPPALQPQVSAWLAGLLHQECVRPEAGSQLAIEALVLELLVLASRQKGPGDRRRPPWLGRVSGILEDDPFRRWSLAGLAAEVGAHPVHLSRTFRRFEGRPLGELAREVRIRAACRLLARSQGSLADVALEAGFSDQSHFTRVFRRVTGLTPGEFRRRFATG